MIPIKRPALPPSLFTALHFLQKEAASFIDGRDRKGFSGHGFGKTSDFMPFFLDVFNKKCAFCETPFAEEEPALVERFKPASFFPDLAYRWENLYLCCRYCRMAKGNRYPTRPTSEGPEEALLLDPCAVKPTAHLAFTVDGRLAGLTQSGRTTIDVFRLNRPYLVDRRASAIQTVRRLLRAGKRAQAVQLCRDSMAFAGAARSALSQSSKQSNTDVAVSSQKRFEVERALREEKLLLSASRTLSASVNFIERIELRNIGSIAHLDLRVPVGKSTQAPWLMILGDNGVGKSTILKAVAFALAGDVVRSEIGPLAESLLPESGVGHITVHLSSVGPVEIKLDTQKRQILRSHEAPQTAFLAYGPSRLLPNQSHRALKEKRYARLRNLYDPFMPLADADAWLMTLDARQFEHVASTLTLLLNLPKRANFKRDGQVRLHGMGKPCALDKLSDGYRSGVALGCDIMSVLLVGNQLPEAAEAVVLIDELGNHLHPTWRIRIVSALRAAFPRVQFIATTHDPLCLRGVEDAEVVVLKRDDRHRLHSLARLPPARGLLVDQLLSSNYFGLFSTLDPHVDALFARYYQLLAKPKRGKREEALLSKLTSEVRDLKMLGNTPRDEALLRVIDEHLSISLKKQVAVDPRALPNDVLKKLRKILSSVGA